jgi:glutamine synthetase
MYTDGHTVTDAKRLPLDLLDVLRALDRSTIRRQGLGDAFVAAYLKPRHDDWNADAGHLTDWERQATLDC